MNNRVTITNKRASFEYAFINKYITGIILKGSEIKSIREGKATINDAYCFMNAGEMFVKGMHIAEYKNAGQFGHIPTADRKLLLTKNELKKIGEALKNKGLTIIPIRLFINEKGFAKLEIAVAKGKKIHDKREAIKKRETERELRRDFRV
ncbi:MAG: SsrA-binding protein SmpB [Bacteroidetes bacterium]|nr:SsrA-binding protein SmpB [Bacteroidota bacterium]